MESEARSESLTPSDTKTYTTTSSGDELSEIFQSHLQIHQSTFSLSPIPAAVTLPPTPTPPVFKQTWASLLNPIASPLTPSQEISSNLNSTPFFPPPELRTPPNDIQDPIDAIGLRTAVIFQEACMNHTYTRTKDIASILSIVERPERIRAIKTGVATAWARLENKRVTRGGREWRRESMPSNTGGGGVNLGELDELMSSLGLKDSSGKGKAKEVIGGPFDILFSTAILPVDNKSLLYIHPLPNLPPIVETTPNLPPPPPTASPSFSSARKVPTTPNNKVGLQTKEPSIIASESLAWPFQLQKLCQESTSAITLPPFSEIPSHLPQGDLYLSSGSESAIFGALGAVCEGVDRIMEGVANGSNGYDRAFVAIRPPGHHCCEDQPMGFCFVNNVAVAAAHAYHEHGVDRVIILDIDLHHGNGTQDIAWRINAAANSAAILPTGSPRKGSPQKIKRRELQVMYGSLHDVFSYPCEDGDAGMIQAASLNLSGGHSQYISNVHLEPWTNEEDFYARLYPRYIAGLLGAASEFCQKSAVGNEDASDKTLVIISAGFDASEHESAGMSRHRRNVPTSFYHRFTLDAVQFANKHSKGKILSVLEGGYSDRALASGTVAMMTALSDGYRIGDNQIVGQGDQKLWWEEKALVQIEKACKPKKGGKLTGTASYSSILSGNSTSSSSNSSPSIGSASEQHQQQQESWLAKTVEIFSIIEGTEIGETLSIKKEPLAKVMQLRERKPRGITDVTPAPSPNRSSRVIRATSKIIMPELERVVKIEEIVKVVDEGPSGATPTVPLVTSAPKLVKFTFKAAGF